MPGAIDYAALLAELGSETFSELRPPQAEVLAAYARHGDAADVAIESASGSGKGLIALLIAEAWRREGRSAVVLSANRALAWQTEREAAAAGIDARLLEGGREDLAARDLRLIQRAHAVGVMNYWVYLNQKPALDPADLVVFDDAHLADAPLHSLYSFGIARGEQRELFQRLADELALRLPHYGSLVAAAGEGRGPGAAEVVSFTDQHAVAEAMSAVIDAAVLPPRQAFQWARLRGRLDRCVLFASPDVLWLRPWVYPLQTNDHYRRADQRLYLSATIGDPADLSRRLGSGPIELIRASPDGAATPGRRLLVLEPGDDGERTRAALIAALRTSPKSVWLCASHAELDRVAPLLAQLEAAAGQPRSLQWRVNGNGEAVERFRAAERGHLLAAGRFDGIGFDGGECRLVVLPELPRTSDPQEAFIAAQLGGGGVLAGRQSARIVQALGRANRSRDDHAVYFLTDPRFAAYFGRESRRRSLPGDLNVDVDLAQDAAEESARTVAARVREFVGGDFDDYDRRRAEAVGPPPSQPPPAWAEAVARPEVDGHQALWLGDYRRAERSFTRWRAACREHELFELGAFASWSAAKAAFLAGEQGDEPAKERARRLLEQAIAEGGRFAAWFNGLRASMPALGEPERRAEAVDGAREQILQAFDAHLLAHGAAPGRLERLRVRVSEELASGSHSRCQLALEQLGALLGYRAIRPKVGRAVTDVRWTGTFAGFREMLCLELKVEHRPHNKVSARDVDQALGQVASAESEWRPRGFAPRGALITPLEEIDPEAVGRLGSLAAIRHDGIEALWERVGALLGLFAEGWSPDDARARAEARERIAPLLPETGWLPRALDAGGPWVTGERLLAEWAEA